MRRLLLSIVLISLLCSCGNPPVESSDVHDSVDRIDTTTILYTNVYADMTATAVRVILPTLIEPGAMQKLPGLKIDSATGYEMFPPGFDPTTYKSIYCNGRSEINNEVNALWFCLSSAGDYEDGPDNIDILIVLYKRPSGEPIDVYAIASQSLAYSYSYMTADSIFTVEESEMEDINITTTVLSVLKSGFVPHSSKSKTFDMPIDREKSSEYARAFMKQHGYTAPVNE